MLIHFTLVCLTQNNIFLNHHFEDNKKNQFSGSHSLLTLRMEGILKLYFHLIVDNDLKDNSPCIIHSRSNMCILLLVCNRSFILQSNSNLCHMLKDKADIEFHLLKVHNLFCISNISILMFLQLLNKKRYLYFISIQILWCKFHIHEDHLQATIRYKFVFCKKCYSSSNQSLFSLSFHPPMMCEVDNFRFVQCKRY